MLIGLLEYIDLSHSEWQHKTNIWEGLPCPLHHSSLLYFILSISIVTNQHILLKFALIIPAFCSLLLASNYYNNFAGKIDASLHTNNSYNFRLYHGKAKAQNYCTMKFSKQLDLQLRTQLIAKLLSLVTVNEYLICTMCNRLQCTTAMPNYNKTILIQLNTQV